MAKYTQNIRIQKSYEVYKRYVSNIKTAKIEPLGYREYKQIYLEKSARHEPNIARDVAHNVNVVTTQTEARDIYDKVKDYFGEDETFKDDFLSVREIQNLSGRELWDYLKDLGFSDREAGATYDGEKTAIDKKTGEVKTVKTYRYRGVKSQNLNYTVKK